MIRLFLSMESFLRHKWNLEGVFDSTILLEKVLFILDYIISSVVFLNIYINYLNGDSFFLLNLEQSLDLHFYVKKEKSWILGNLT